MKRMLAGTAVIVVGLTFVASPASAQMGGPTWTSKDPRAVESDGEVVLTLSLNWARPAHVRYQTLDGTARAPEDYSSVSGEVFFTDDTPTAIRIPIVEDDLAEDFEVFTVETWEVPADKPDRVRPPGQQETSRERVTVRIFDNETGNRGEEPGVTASGQARNSTSPDRRSSGSASGVSPPTRAAGAGAAAEPAATRSAPPSDLELALPSGELRAGPGFELTNEGAAVPTRQRQGGGGATAGLAIGSGAAAVGVGALAVVRRRMRWSPSQS